MFININSLQRSEQHKFLAKKADYAGGKLSSNSFRAGLATALARFGVGEDEIKDMGRQKSEAFNLYGKHGRVGNLLAQKKIFGQIKCHKTKMETNQI